MMTIDQIRKTLECSRQNAVKMLNKAGLNPVEVPFSHGKKHLYKVTPERLLEIKANQQKDPQKIAMQQADALSRIESVFLQRF